MSALTFTCQHDHCGKTGTDRADFKKIEVQFRPINFAYILCNEHAKNHETETTMSTLETRIAEVLAAHSIGAFSGDSTACQCDRTWRKNADHRKHLTEAIAVALAPVITSSNAAAWHEGYRDGQRQDAEGDDGPRFTNPYRADKLVTE